MRDNYGDTFQNPTLSIADGQTRCSVSWHWHLHGPPPGQAEEYRRADAVLLDLGAEPLWAQLAWAALRYEEKTHSPASNPYLDRCAEVLTALRGPPDAEGWTILFEPAPAGGVTATLLGCMPDEDQAELEREIDLILFEFAAALRSS